MGFFDKFKSNKEKVEKKVLPWIALTDVSQLKEIEAKSKTKTQAIFKHSTRCGISSMVIRQFESMYELDENQADLYYLDLLNYRPISEEIAARFQVMHQSPQLVVVKNGNTVHHSSHHDISARTIEKYV